MKKRIKAILDRTDTMTVPPGYVIDRATKRFLESVCADIGWLIEHLEGKDAAIEVLADEVRELTDERDELKFRSSHLYA